jgi:dolichol-phosphate mannosyltransferase
MQPEPYLSVVLPAYREAENLRNLLPKIRQVLDVQQLRYEILVVDTPQPTDDSPRVCEQHAVRYISRTPGECYGDAVRSGLSASCGRYIIFMDADGSHSPDFISNLLEYAPEYDVVIASRYMPGGSTENSFALTAMSRVLNVTYSLVLGLPCKDVSNSFRLYNGELVRQLELTCSNFDIVEELLVRMRACRGRLDFKEIPFRFQAREHGVTKRQLSTFIATYVSTMARLWWAGRSQASLQTRLPNSDQTKINATSSLGTQGSNRAA